MRCASPPDSEPAGPVEREVVEADVEQEVEPLLDLLEHPLGDLLLAGRQLEVAQEVGGLVDRQRADLGDRLAARWSPPGETGLSRLPWHAGHGTSRMKPSKRSRLVSDSASRVPALDVGPHALELGVVGALAAVAVGGDARGPWSGGRRAGDLRALAGSLSHGVLRSKPSSSPSAPMQPEEVVGDVGLAPRAGSRPRRASPAGRARRARGRPPSGCRGRGTRGRRRTGELKENDRGSSSSVSMVWSLGQAIFSENFSSRRGSFAGRSTKSRTTSPPARPSAVSTESVSRRLDDALTASRSTTTSIVCFFCLSSFGGSSSGVGLAVDPGPGEALRSAAGGTARRTRPCGRGSTGASTWKRRALLEREHPVDDLLRGLPLDRRAADRAVRPAGAGVEQAEVVVDLGDRADGGAGVLRRGLLVDRDRRATGPR